MKCNGFWGLADSPPNTYTIEFKKEEVEELASKSTSTLNYALFGAEVLDILVSEYKRHNKGVDK